MGVYVLTAKGMETAEAYIRELEAKRKEILDAGKDTADETNLPGIGDILADIELTGLDDDYEYLNSWGVTDNYDADSPLLLKPGVELAEVPSISATAYANFFDFAVRREDGTDPEGNEYRYVAKDVQKVFKNRYISDVSGLAECFDCCLPDYVDSYLEENGFEYVKDDRTYYEQALKWIETEKPERIYGETEHAVVAAIVYMGQNITDDLSETKAA